MFRVDFRRQSRVLRWGLAAVYLPVTAVYAVLWFLGACFYYGVACAFYSRVGWAHASRAAWSMTCDALFFACLIGVNLVAAAGRLALWLWRWVRRLFPPLQVIIHWPPSSSSESDERVLLSRLSLFLRLNSSLRLDFTIKRNAFHFQSSLSSICLERFARRDGLSAMAVSVLVLMEDRQLCAFICAHSYFHFFVAQIYILLARIQNFVDYFCARARSTVALSNSRY